MGLGLGLVWSKESGLNCEVWWIERSGEASSYVNIKSLTCINPRLVKSFGISHQAKAPASLTLTHQSPTSYWLHHVCMYFQYSVFFNKFFGLFYIELMVSGNLSFYILTDMRLCFYGILCKLIISTSPNRVPYYVERMWNMYILVILIDW